MFRRDCAQKTLEMVTENPKLKRIRGHYYCPLSNQKHPHWWLKDKSNNIIDPTKNQFLSHGVGDYIEWDEFKEEPTGKCINCGEYTYRLRNSCSNKCQKELDYEFNKT